MMIDILLQAQAIPVVIGTADYAIGTAIPYILGAIGAGATGAWVKNHWQEIKDAAGERIVRPVFGSERKYAVRSNPMVVQSDATRVARPVVVPTRRDIDLHLGQHRTATKAIPISRVRIKVASAPADTTQAKAGSTEAQRDDTGTATGNTSSQNTGNTSRRRLTAKERLTGKLNETSNTNSTTPNTDNNPGFFRRNKKTLIGIGGVVGAPYIFNIGKKGFNTWIDAWGFRGDEDKDKLQNTDSIQKQESVQNDTTQAYNGFLINQQNLVE